MLTLGVSNYVMGVNKFSVTIKFPNGFDFTKLNVGYDNGKSQVNIKLPPTKNGSIIVSGEYYSIYAAIILRYPKSKHYNYGNSFFLTQKPAQITFIKSDTISSPFDNYKLINAYDFKIEKDKMNQNSGIVLKELEDLALSLGDDFNKVFEDSTELNKSWNTKNRILFDKEMDYVSKTGDSYYSFWYFRRDLSRPYYINADSTIRFFTTTFPSKFINSTEGNTILTLISGQETVKKGNTAPDFVCKDATGNTVSLKDYRQKKYVLLTFWATWCGPCLQEIPEIKSIRKKYSNQNLEIISVCYPSSQNLFSKEIKKQKMDWINIYNDVDMINSYGGYKGIPRVYLINLSGQIIYDRLSDDANMKGPELPKLRKYLSELKLDK